MPVIWVNRKAEYFYRRDWTTQITLIGLGKFDFTRKLRRGRIRPHAAPKSRDGRTNSGAGTDQVRRSAPSGRRRAGRPGRPDRGSHHFLPLGLWPAGVLADANGLTGAAPPFLRFLSAFGFFFSLLLRI
jgi:hypothetical protein